MTPDQAWPLAAPALALVALLCWTRWARRGGALAWWAGVLALAAAIDALRELAHRVEDDAGGPSPATLRLAAGAVFAVLALRAWRRLGTHRAPAAESAPVRAPDQGPGPDVR